MENLKQNSKTDQQNFQLRKLRSNEAERTFSRAVQAANRGRTEQAREYARDALFHARFHSAQLHTDAHALMANLLMDNGDYEQAKFHCWEARALLNPSDYSYAEDLRYFKALERSIDRKIPKKIHQQSELKAA